MDTLINIIDALWAMKWWILAVYFALTVACAYELTAAPTDGGE